MAIAAMSIEEIQWLLDSWKDTISKVDLSRFPIQIEISVEPHRNPEIFPAGVLELVLRQRVIDVDDPDRAHYIWVYKVEPMTVEEAILSERGRARHLRNLVTHLLHHEIDETFWFEGKPLDKPHKGRKNA